MGFDDYGNDVVQRIKDAIDFDEIKNPEDLETKIKSLKNVPKKMQKSMISGLLNQLPKLPSVPTEPVENYFSIIQKLADEKNITIDESDKITTHTRAGKNYVALRNSKGRFKAVKRLE